METGIEKICQDIREESDKVIMEIRAQADKNVQEILAASAAETEKTCLGLRKKGQDEADAIRARARSAAELEQKQQILAARQECIAFMTEQALESIRQLPVEQYFTLVAEQAAAAAHQTEGKLLLGREDRTRVPADFEEQVNRNLSGKAHLTVAAETAPIQSGCLLVYGDIEENCSFEELLTASRDQIQDRLKEILF